jgi:DNA invertase Pin-like site-specific DNA recombinase
LLDFEAVVVWRIDRFGRSFYGTTQNLKTLLDLKLNFISMKDSFDTNTTTGRMMAHLLIVIAEYFRDVLKENTRAGMKKAAKEGHVPGPKIDPRKGASRTTRWRRRKRAQVA